MHLRAFEVDTVRERVAQAAPLTTLLSAPVTGISLDAALEFACASRSWTANDAVALKGQWAARLPFLHRACDAFLRAPDLEQKLSTAELYRIASAADWLDEHRGQRFLVRFNQALRRVGFPVAFAQGLEKAFSEMTDNVIQHSGPHEGAPALAVAGFHVADNWMSFAVADTGRGVLESLRANSKWFGLQNSAAALSAALEQRATRRAHEPQGHGFREVLRALANRSALLRFRSGDGCLTFDGELSAPTFDRAPSPEMPGFQLAVICGLRGPPTPRPVEVHALA